MRTPSLPLLALVLGACLLATPALAKNPHYGDDNHGRGKSSHQSRPHHDNGPAYQDDRDVNLSFHFSDENRERLRHYYRERYEYRPYDHRPCPPGLAKHGYGCVPPGHAVRRYRIGERLPVYAQPVPQELFVQLRPPARGTYYAMVDSDVVLVTEATKKILDAVTLLSAME